MLFSPAVAILFTPSPLPENTVKICVTYKSPLIFFFFFFFFCVTKQGTVFERVIQDVCDASQVDFEENGVDQQTLLDLRTVG